VRIRWLVACAIAAAFMSPARGQSPLFTSPNSVALPPKTGQYVWVAASQKFAADEAGSVEADCPRGYVVISGGYSLLPQGPAATVVATRPNGRSNGWMVALAAGPAASVSVYAGCAAPD
jgi:hypothetical protein